MFLLSNNALSMLHETGCGLPLDQKLIGCCQKIYCAVSEVLCCGGSMTETIEIHIVSLILLYITVRL